MDKMYNHCMVQYAKSSKKDNDLTYEKDTFIYER